MKTLIIRALIVTLFGVFSAHAESRDNKPLYKALLEILQEGSPGPNALTVPSDFDAKAIEYFERQVRPIFAERCIECHGVEKQKSEFRVDSRDALLKGGEKGPAIIPRNPEGSRLVEFIRRTGEIKMPPDDPLPTQEIDILIQWIGMGAPWPAHAAQAIVAETMKQRIQRARREHWAFAPVQRPAIPNNGAASPIDALVRSYLEERGLKPAKAAGPATLLRRLSFDLLGLPPTYEEVQAFTTENSPRAYENAVDRMLASPHFGERWARYWLDVARYSDTKGYVFEEERSFAFSHTYRDYVINAYNDDLPYDDFIVDQLAADQLEVGEDKSALAAMGFLTLGRRFINNIHDITDDRIDVVTRGLMGLTVTCARCHDHKYDPIAAADYYALYGVFRSSHEPAILPLIETPDPEDPDYKDFIASLRKTEKELDTFKHRQYVKLSQHAREGIGDYLLAAHDARDIEEQGKLQELAKERELHWQLVQRWRDYLKSEALQTDPVFWPLRAFAPLSETEYESFATAIATTERSINQRVQSAIKETPPANMDDLCALYGKLFADADDAWLQNIAAAFQIASRTDGDIPVLPERLDDPHQEALRLTLYGTATPANVPKNEVEQFLDIPTRNTITRMRIAVQKVEATHPGRPDRAMVMNDNEKPFEAYVFKRGKPGDKGDAVSRRFVEVLSKDDAAPFENGSGRLELARAIANENNPLTARVYVNRVWSHLFGRPLVDTPSDFGLRSTPPAYPKLLDYLAADFMASGWSTKKLIKSIVMSHTYRQSSQTPRDLIESDPDNRLLARQNRRRLDFEALRDAWLAVADNLDREQGGPSVKITQPPFTTRRTIYSHIERQNLPALFRTFDFASPDTHSPGRFQTTVPKQALFMMNSPFIIRQARVLVKRSSIQSCDKGEDRIAALHRILFQREPVAEEISAGLRYLDRRLGPEGPPPPPPSPWTNGYGEVNTIANATTAFTPLPYFGETTWKGGPTHPDETLGWVSLTHLGGHPGGDPEHAAIRRWVAPYDALLTINGNLRHPNEKGDGVIGYIVHNRLGILWTKPVHNAKEMTALPEVLVMAGDTLDFAVAPGANESYDSFTWTPHISLLELRGDDADTGGKALQWHAQRDFSGPPQKLPDPLTPWESYAQVLLLTNEFAFID